MFILYIFSFIYGSCIGSFINALIYRIDANESMLKKPSHCERCNKKIAWFDLIPVISYLLLQGRCRYCKKSISPNHLIIEIIMGALFLTIFATVISRTDLTLETLFIPERIQALFWLDLLYFSTITAILMIIALYDLKNMLILDEYVVGGVAVTLLYQGLRFVISDISIITTTPLIPFVYNDMVLNAFMVPSFLAPVMAFLIPVMAGLAVGGFFLILVLGTGGKGMGGGDIKLGFLVGIASSWPYAMVAVFTSFFTGAIISIILLAIKRKKFGQTIPFGPFLALATFITLIWGEQLLTLYMQGIGGI